MSGLDPDLRQSLRNLSAGIRSDPDDLPMVRERAAAADRSSRRTVLAAAAAAVLLLGAGLFVLGNGGFDRDVRPVEPLPTGPAVPNPFVVVRTLSSADTGIENPLDVAVSPDGRLYVTDSGQHVTELDADGRVIRRWGGEGSKPGRLRMFGGNLDVGDDGRVYVTDTGNFRVQVFSPDGAYLTAYGSYGQGPGQFVFPSDVLVGHDGTVYVVDDTLATLTALSPRGGQLWRLGDKQTTDPDLIGHEHLGNVDPEGRLVTANDDSGKVLYLDAAGHKVDVFGSGDSAAHENGPAPPVGDFPDGACGATTDAAGNVYVASCGDADEGAHLIQVYGPDHRLIGAWTGSPMVASPDFGSDGTAYAVTSGGDVVEVRLDAQKAR